MTRSNLPVESTDGWAHLAYFDVDTQLSFVTRGNVVEVSHGGYGEGVIDRFVCDLLRKNLYEARITFEQICKTYTQAYVKGGNANNN